MTFRNIRAATIGDVVAWGPPPTSRTVHYWPIIFDAVRSFDPYIPIAPIPFTTAFNFLLLSGNITNAAGYRISALMHTSTGCVVRSGPSYTLLSASRTVAGRHLRPTCRRQQGQTSLLEHPKFVTKRRDRYFGLQRRFASTSTPTDDRSARGSTQAENDHYSGEPIEPIAGDTVNATEARSKAGEKKFYGSYRRRASRGSPEEKLAVPDWFLSSNVTLNDELNSKAPRLEVVDEQASTDSKRLSASAVETQAKRPDNGAIYQIDKVIFDEIGFMMLGGLRASSTSSTEDSLNSRSHLLLQSPQPGAEIFLDAVVMHAAQTRKLDLLTIDPQDIADIAAAIPAAFSERSLTQIRRLGFDTYLFDDDHFSESPEESTTDQEGIEDSLDVASEDRPKTGPFHLPTMGTTSIKPIQHMIQVWFPSKHGANNHSQETARRPFNNSFPSFFSASNKSDDFMVSPEYDSSALIRKFLDSHLIKRERQRSVQYLNSDIGKARAASELHSEPEDLGQRSQGLIVHIKDYLELSSTGIGGAVLDKIHAVVDAKRREGRPILIVGTSSSSDLVPSISESGISAMQSGSESDKFRTIVTTCRTPDVEPIFLEDAKVRNAQINCRNILATLRELFPDSTQLDPSLLEPNFGLSTEQMFQFDLAEEVWPLDRVQRLTSIASGMLESGKPMSGDTLSLGLGVMEVSDKAKFAWANQELKKLEPSSATQVKSNEKQEEKKKALLKNCNRYEKKLMSGVIDAQKIKTSFDDVHVPPSTIEALKTLTTLSLVRPEAFTYGVLATDRIPGLLLYGPPGTGKTMLAKAVAKESGATVLDVAGSDVYDMYVGEGEKNIRAIFTLARKLSPCVVFIDEADAIFGSRSGSHNRKSHRELINQFLREWDGMNELSAFIMVATNRPFDLDDAVLRRLPRRLLVDLPTQKDREAILRIHLKDEHLAEDISLHNLAQKTPYYSGSDLKNLSVAAALACVREENDAASMHSSNGEYQYPQRRTLRADHFEKAMSEISASISEDMSSLSAIRKFDERYGDKGRRKRSGGLGFGTATVQDQEREKREEGRVRKAEVVLE